MNHSIVNERYQIQECLSDKGTRQTFLALDLDTQTSVVLKVLRFDRNFQWQDHKLFERGANALQALSHPRIPQYLDYFDLDTDRDRGFCQVQRYIPAKSLQQYLDAGRTFSEEEMQQLAKDLLEILIYLHSRQPAVIHRDIKPSNILLGDRTGNHVGEVFLVDFDSVQTHGSAQPGSTMTIVGTYGYMPPEQFGGKAYPASDLYSLGATLIAIATGKQPADLPQKNLKIDFEEETNLSLDFTNWLKWLVEPALDLRLSSAREALQMLGDPSSHPKRFQTHSIAIGKPNESRIILRQRNHTLHLIIPALGLNQQSFWSKVAHIVLFLLGLTIFVPFFLLIIVMIVGALVEDPTIFFAVIFLLFPAGIGFLMMLPLLIALLWETHLEINPNDILMYENLIVKLKRKKSARQNLLAIRTDKGIFTRNRLLLVASDRTFIIPTINEQESLWLAEELSQCLKLPIHSN